MDAERKRMTDDDKTGETLKDLLSQPIETMADGEALQHVGGIVDLGADMRSLEITDRAIRLLTELDARKLSDQHAVLKHYFLSNAYATRVEMASESGVWAWEQPDRQRQIIELRRAMRHPGFNGMHAQRQCQILTNLANQLNTVGRFVEAIELWDRSLELNSNFAMALGNRGSALIHYGKALYDTGHAGLMYVAAHDGLEAAIVETAEYESAEPEKMRQHFRYLYDYVLRHVKIESVRKSVSVDEYGYGETTEEQGYRKWCLANRLFLNPLNDLGAHSIAARDVLMLPSLRAPISLLPPPFIGFFNQMKQEYVSARFFYYESFTADGVHYSDKDVLLYNTLEYPAYCLAVERMRAAYRIGYSLLDKIGFFINSYFAVGYKPNQVYFSKVWREPPGNKPNISERFSNCENWPLRGLYWVSKDIYDEELHQVTEPDAQALKDVREHLEHKYLQAHEDWAFRHAGIEPSKGTDDLAIYPIGREELAAKTLRVLKLVRAALIYLSLAVHREERERGKVGDPDKVMPSNLDTWEDEWKQ
jgi:tetratricopeptide (TPR) repeat protein